MSIRGFQSAMSADIVCSVIKEIYLAISASYNIFTSIVGSAKSFHICAYNMQLAYNKNKVGFFPMVCPLVPKEKPLVSVVY